MRWTARRSVWLALATIVWTGCQREKDEARADQSTKPKPKPTVTGAKKTPAPEKHRTATRCPKTVIVDAHDRMGPSPGGPCSADADCKAEKNGRCTSKGTCTYDECYLDSDCKKGVCMCEEYGKRGYYCLEAGDCRTDEDCGDDYCSPTFDLTCGPYHGVIAHRCHTPDDKCQNDEDCRKDGQSFGYCAFHPEVGHWACGYAMCKG